MYVSNVMFYPKGFFQSKGLKLLKEFQISKVLNAQIYLITSLLGRASIMLADL
jgi:hypothetical protein